MKCSIIWHQLADEIELSGDTHPSFLYTKVTRSEEEREKRAGFKKTA